MYNQLDYILKTAMRVFEKNGTYDSIILYISSHEYDLSVITSKGRRYHLDDIYSLTYRPYFDKKIPRTYIFDKCRQSNAVLFDRNHRISFGSWYVFFVQEA